MSRPAYKHYQYTLAREKQDHSIPWVRPAELKWLDLPRPIVLVNGAYDLLTASHMRLIFTARTKGATVVCALDTDAKIKKEKGLTRPILTFIERATALNYMPIDIIVPIDNKRDMNTLMAALQPDLRVQGSEYKGLPSRYQTPKLFVRNAGVHTSEVERRILNART